VSDAAILSRSVIPVPASIKTALSLPSTRYSLSLAIMCPQPMDECDYIMLELWSQ